MLGVQRPDLKMHVKALEVHARKVATLENWQDLFKRCITSISALNPTRTDVKPLLNSNIFPVRIGDGTVKPTTSYVEFAIIDKEEYEGLFPRLHTLAFTLSEVNSYRPFLHAMGLAGRYMSVLVHEETKVEGGTLDLPLTRSLQARAYALYR